MFQKCIHWVTNLSSSPDSENLWIIEFSLLDLYLDWFEAHPLYSRVSMLQLLDVCEWMCICRPDLLFNFSILFGQAMHTLRIPCSLLEHNSGSKAGQYSRESEHNLGIIRDLFSQQSLIEGICLLRQRQFWSIKTLLKDERYFNMRISEVVNKLSCKTKAKREGKICKFIYMQIDTKLRNVFRMISISFFSGHNLHRQLSGQKHKRWKWRGCIDRYNKVNSGQGVPKKVTNRMPLEPWWTRSITKTCYWQS